MNIEIDIIESYKKVEKTEMCCGEMGVFYRSEGAGFGEKYGDYSENVDVNNYVSIYAYDFDLERWQSFPISFCPFCGSKIKVRVEAIDCVSEAEYREERARMAA